MQNEIKEVSHNLKRTRFFQEDSGSFVFKREVNLRFPEKDRKAFLDFHFYKIT